MRLALLFMLALSALSGTAQAKPWVWQQDGDYLNALAVGGDGSIVTFAANRLVRFAPSGKVKLNLSLDRHIALYDLAFAPNGDLLAVGIFSSDVELAGKQLKAKDISGLVARFAPNGSLRWAVPVTASQSVFLSGIAVGNDRIVAVGHHRGEGRVGGTEFGGDGALQITFDARGKVLGVAQFEYGFEGRLVDVCATRDGFIVAAWNRKGLTNETSVVHKIDTKGRTLWTYEAPSEPTGLACRADGTSFLAIESQGLPPDGNYSLDLAIHELTPSGKLARKLAIVTDGRDKLLSLTAAPHELVVASRHQANESGPTASRLSRFDPAGTLISADDYTAANSIFLRAAHRGKQLVLAGEVMRGASANVSGHQFAGPSVFVIAP